MSRAQFLTAIDYGAGMIGIAAASYVFAHVDPWWPGALACAAYLFGAASGMARMARR